MKAVILSRVPGARIIDYTHHVPPFSIVQAGFFLWSGYFYFPETSVIVCVVDPGVGTNRRTFHGRDVFAPLAARVMSGERPEELGKEISPESLVRSSWADSRRQGNRIRTHVLHVDGFGNCLLGLVIKQWQQIVQTHGKMILHPLERVVTLVGTYGELDPGRIGFLAGSQGVYELCLREDDAAKKLGLAPGDRVELELVEE
jgi:hypothetical protein